MVSEVNDIETFNKIIAEQDKVLIDFWAPWCGPCQALMPTVNSVAEKVSDQVTTVKVNIDELPTLAQKFGVRAIPTLLFFSGSEIKARSSGLISEQALLDLVQ